MSVRLLRQGTLSHIICSACVRTPGRRCYASQLALRSEHDQTHDETRPDEIKSSEHSGAGPAGAGATPSPASGSKRTRKSRKRDLATTDSDSTPRRNPLEPTNVDKYLASLQVAGLEPTVFDLERCRPLAHAHQNSPQYIEEYNKLVDTLCRSFSKKQLRAFMDMLNLGAAWSMRKKVDYAESIIEQAWGWPSLKEVEKAKRDRTEVSVESFPISPSELFLILGPDGADLLAMSMEYNVHISLTQNPLALRVEGLLGSLKKISKHVATLKRQIVEETFQLPTQEPIRPDLVQRISRLAGSFIENAGPTGQVRVLAKSARSLATAKRLVSRAAHELRDSSQVPALSYLPVGVALASPVPNDMFPHMYSLYPFLSPRSLPWIMNTAGAFRVRRVGEWLGKTPGEDVIDTGGLSAGRGQFYTSGQDHIDLRHALLDDLPELPEHGPETKRSVTASMGHVLFTTPSQGQRASLIPPLKGSHQLSKILNWIESSDVRTSFVSSLPASLVKSSPPEQHFLHRLVYKALPTSLQDSTKVSPRTRSELSRTITLEVKLLEDGLVSDDGAANMDDIVKMDCRRGLEAALDLMMPDRPMDMRLSVKDATAFPEGQEPTELEGYMTDFYDFLGNQDPNTTQPDPPLMFAFEGHTYILYESASIRQSTERIQPSENGSPEPPITVVTESVLDLESNQKETRCEITCTDTNSEEMWKQFLADCDLLTSALYGPIRDTTVSNIDNDAT